MQILSRSAEFNVESPVLIRFTLEGDEMIVAIHSDISAHRFESTGRLIIDVNAHLETVKPNIVAHS